MTDEIRKLFDASLAAVAESRDRLAPQIIRAADAIVSTLRSGGAVLVFGNGGSAADAQHIAGELVGRFLRERKAFRVEALTTDTSVMTAVANDYGYDAIFARQIEGKGRPGDAAMAISTSGNSPSIVAALTQARACGMKTIALTGPGGGKCAPLADVLLDVNGGNSPRIQEAHAVIYHVICELVERQVCGE